MILLDDFKVNIGDPWVEFFCNSYRFRSLIKDPTCFKNSENPSCIDLILTSNPYSFHNSCAIEVGLSDFHEIIITVKKTTFQKMKPKIVLYRDYIKFSNDNFRKKLLMNLSMESIGTNTNSLENFPQLCIGTFDQFAPEKKKYILDNNRSFFKQVHKKKESVI